MTRDKKDKLRVGRYGDFSLEELKFDTNIRSEYDDESIDVLAKSMKEYGQLQNIRIYEKGSEYFVIFGKRRCLAAKKAGFTTIRADIVSEPKPIEKVYLQAIENELNKSLSPQERESYLHSLVENGESFQKIAEIIGISEAWVRECVGAYKVRKDYQPLLAEAGIPFSTKDLYAFRNANEGKVKEAIARVVINPENKKDILEDVNIRTKKKLNVGGKLKKREDETTVLSGKIVLDILIDEEKKNIQINTRNSKKVDKVLVTSLRHVVYEFFKGKNYQSLIDSTRLNPKDEDEEKITD